MKIFGNKKEFAIELDYYIDRYKDDTYFKENTDSLKLGAVVYFWVKNKNLFAFNSPTMYTYSFHDLHCLISFLSEHLAQHICEEPFPIETKATNAQDMIEETALIKKEYENDLQAYADLDWDNIDMDLREKRNNWMQARSFAYHRDTSFLPDIMVRRVKDKIEISWNNHYPHEDEGEKFYFTYIKGVEYVDINLYREVILQFCLEYIKCIKKDEPDLAESYHNNLKDIILTDYKAANFSKPLILFKKTALSYIHILKRFFNSNN